MPPLVRRNTLATSDLKLDGKLATKVATATRTTKAQNKRSLVLSLAEKFKPGCDSKKKLISKIVATMGESEIKIEIGRRTVERYLDEASS